MKQTSILPRKYSRLSKYHSDSELIIHQSLSESLEKNVRVIPNSKQNQHRIFAFSGPYLKQIKSDVDFVIVDNYRGVFYIEVKGGAYSGKDGNNYTRAGLRKPKKINEKHKTKAISYLSKCIKSELRKNKYHSLIPILREYRILIRTGTDKRQAVTSNDNWDFIWGAKDAENVLSLISESIEMNEMDDKGFQPHVFRKPFKVICEYLTSLTEQNPAIEKNTNQQVHLPPSKRTTKKFMKKEIGWPRIVLFIALSVLLIIALIKIV